MMFRQTSGMSNADYFRRFKDLWATYEHLGGDAGLSIATMERYLTTEEDEDATNEEVLAAREAGTDQYLGIRFLRRSDPKRYGTLLAEIENQHTRGIDTYPTNLSGAYDMIVNYVDPHRHLQTSENPSTGMAFYQQSAGNTNNNNNNNRNGNNNRQDNGGDRGQQQDPSGRGGGRGDGGRGGRGGGRGGGGRGNGGGGGRGNGDNNAPTPDDAGGNNDSDQQNNNNNNTSIPPYPLASNSTSSHSPATNVNMDYDTPYPRAAVLLQKVGGIPDKWMLADSCSSIDIIVTRSMLHGIHDAKQPLRLRCNAGVVTLTQQGYLGDYPEPVWYDPDGVANIMSLRNLTKHYRVTMDSAVSNSLSVHKDNGDIYAFTPSDNGLYRHELQSVAEGATMWSLVTTVNDKAQRYTKRDTTAAAQARKMQNIIMHPSDHTLAKSAIKHLKNCPITEGDVRRAIDIFGPKRWKSKRENRTSAIPSCSIRHRPCSTGYPVATSGCNSHRRTSCMSTRSPS